MQRRIAHWYVLLPLAVTTWALRARSGIHATVAGVLLGLTVPVSPRAHVPGISTMAAEVDVAQRFEHRLRPLSAGVRGPGVRLLRSGRARSSAAASATPSRIPPRSGSSPVSSLGKLVGVFGGTWLFTRFTRAEIDEDLAWSDVFGLSLLAGVGFTVSLLVGELAFGAGTARDEHVKLAVLLGSLLSAALATAVLLRRNRVYRQLAELESADNDGDGIPDAFQGPDVEGGERR